MATIGTDIHKAKTILEKGGLIGMPTETVYGLAGNAFNPEAVANIFSVKNRPTFDPLIVHIANIKQISQLVLDFPKKAQELADAFWPGPLTLLLKKKPIIPDLVTSGMDTVAIRIPQLAITRELLSQLDYPLVAPSANPFGYISPTTAQHVNDQLGEQLEYILDGGPCQVGIESTIVGFEHEQPVIYRMGGLSQEEIEDVVGPVNVLQHSSSNPKSPGMLKSHYAPATRFVIGDITDLLLKFNHTKVGVLSFKSLYPEVPCEVLSPTGNLAEAAQRLFAVMRLMDDKQLDIILAEQVPHHGLGRAINDRLKRAAAEKN